MRVAAVIFGIGGAGYLMWVAWLAMAYGVRLDTWLRALFALATLVQAYGLWRKTKGARLGGLINATLVAGTAFTIVILFVFPDLPKSFRALDLSDVWPMLGGYVTIAIAFTVAAVFIATSKRAP